jgi:MFS family permease
MATPAAHSPYPRHAQASSAAPSRPALVLASACCGVFVGFGSLLIFTFGVFLKPLTAAFGWSRTEVSFAFTLTALTVAVSSPVLGRLLDRYPARRIILPCVVVYAFGFASLSLLTAHIAHLLIVFVLLGLVGNGTTQLGYARVVSMWFDRSRGRALAAVMAGSGAGSMVFPPLAQALINAYGWRIAYALLGALILVLGVPLTAAFLYEPADPVSRSASGSQDVPSTAPKPILGFPFFALLTGLLLFSLATNGLNTHWSALMTDRGIPAELAATVLSVAGFATLFSKLTTGYLLDRFFAGRVAAYLFAACAAGFLVILASNGTWGTKIWPEMLGALLVGAGMGAESDAVPFLLTRYYGLRRFSELYAYTWSVYAVAGALGPLLMGQLFDRTGSYHNAMILFLALLLVSAALFGSLPEYSPLPRQPNCS